MVTDNEVSYNSSENTSSDKSRKESVKSEKNTESI